MKFLNNEKVTQQNLLNYNIKSFGYLNLFILIREIFLNEEYRIKISDPNVIIDCGANIGLSVLYFRRLFPMSKIIAFEPNPAAFKLLEENMANNGIYNVQLVNACLGNRENKVDFYINENQGSVMGSLFSNRGGKNCISVDCLRLSNFIKGSVDLIKMDIEGAEEEVIEDLINQDKLQHISNFLIEYHHNISGKPSRLGNFISSFENAGFQLKIRGDFSVHHQFQDIFLSIKIKG